MIVGRRGPRSPSTAFRQSLLSSATVFMFVTLAMSYPSNNDPRMFGFDIHHRSSDLLNDIFPLDGWAEKGSARYYEHLFYRDRVFRRRRLAAPDAPLTFLGGNETLHISSLGFLHYANVTVGSPSLSFLVALDTGSSLFWLPCDCKSCVSALKTSSGGVVTLNIYSPSASSSSSYITCSNSLCSQQVACKSPSDRCPYIVEYLSQNTNSLGYLVQDDLLLITDDSVKKRVAAKVIMGCGQVQTGAFLTVGAPNGLFGLGFSSESVPSSLARQGLIADSFSLCFGLESTGRITFGDKGSLNQSVTPINHMNQHQSYNITVTSVDVGGHTSKLSFDAIFDSGTSFTYLSDPTYSAIANKFDELNKHKRSTINVTSLSFDYCYEIPANQKEFSVPGLSFTMKGGGVFEVLLPIEIVELSGISGIYCLAMSKSDSIDIIGQNFMRGYRTVFDREKMILGWERADCNNIVSTSSTSPSAFPPVGSPKSTPTASNGTSSPSSSSTTNAGISIPPSGSNSPPLFPAASTLAITLVLLCLSF